MGVGQQPVLGPLPWVGRSSGMPWWELVAYAPAEEHSAIYREALTLDGRNHVLRWRCATPQLIGAPAGWR